MMGMIMMMMIVVVIWKRFKTSMDRKDKTKKLLYLGWTGHVGTESYYGSVIPYTYYPNPIISNRITLIITLTLTLTLILRENS